MVLVRIQPGALAVLPCRPVPVTHDQLAELEALVADLATQAEAAKDPEARARLWRRAWVLQAAIGELRAGREGLPDSNHGGNTGGMVTAERVRISHGRKKRDALVVAANTSNLTLRSLAEKLEAEGFEVSHSLLSQGRKGKRSISEALVKRVEELTGFKASKANWPRIRKE